MAQATRIYTVSAGTTVRLVRAAHPAQALMHVARAAHEVRVASQDDLEELLTKGARVELARQDQPELPL